MNSTLTIPLAILLSGILSGCTNNSNESALPPCSVSPPQNSTTEKAVKAQVALDLTKFAQAPMSASFSTEASKKISATFNAIPENNFACAMLLQTYLCIRDKDRQGEFFQYLKSTKRCDLSK